jgi:hypothetical protein
MIICFLPLKTGKGRKIQSPGLWQQQIKKAGGLFSPPPAFNLFLVNVSLSADEAHGRSAENKIRTKS